MPDDKAIDEAPKEGPEQQIRIENLVLVADSYGEGTAEDEAAQLLEAVNLALEKLGSCPVLGAGKGGYKAVREPMAEE